MQLTVMWYLFFQVLCPVLLRTAVFASFLSELSAREQPCLLSLFTGSGSGLSQRSDQFWPCTAENQCVTPSQPYTRAQLLSFSAAPLDLPLETRLKELGIGVDLASFKPRRRRCRRGGRRKQKQIEVIVNSRPALNSHGALHEHYPSDDRDFDTTGQVYQNGCMHSNLIQIETSGLNQVQSKLFKVMYLNTQSLRNKTHDVCDHIIQGNYDMVFLTETWLQRQGTEAEIAAVTPPGFTLVSFPRKDRIGGGIAVLYRNSLKKHISFPKNDHPFTTFEMCETRLEVDGQTYVFLCVYRPPPSAKNRLRTSMFLDEFPDLLEMYSTYEKLFVVGDINVHFDDPRNHCTIALNVVLENLSLQQIINVPTQRKGHTLDWVLTNSVSDIADLSVCDMLLSDHFVISFELHLRKPGKSTKKVVSRNLKAIDKHVFKTDVSTAFQSACQSDPSDSMCIYNTCLRQLLDQHAPLITRTLSDRTSAPWMTLEIIQAKVQRRSAERAWRESGLTVHREIYGEQRNIVTHMIKEAKKSYICGKIAGADSSRELFRLSDQLLGKSGDTVLPSDIPPESLPDKFNEFFGEKIERIRRTFDPDTPCPADAVVFSGTQLETFEPVSEDCVRETLEKMPKKSCDLDPIPALLLFDCLDEITPIVTDIMNKSLLSGVVPQCFKHALVKPLLKKTNLDPDFLKNYRPVSNLPFLSKVLERLVLKQLLQHLETHNLLEPFQSAYRKCHSTETALLRVVNDLLQASDNGRVSILSLLDLSAAFDTIDHRILLTRLCTTFGCSGMVLDWFTSYLTGRTQSVVVGHESAPLVLKCGVPQGSVLGPVLFTIYTQPLSTVIHQSGHSYHFFADDSQLHSSSAPSDFDTLACSLKNCIEGVSKWMNENKLKMNEDKTELMVIGTRSKVNQVSQTHMCISGCDVPFSQSVRNLGFYLDETLSMEAHVKQLCRILYLQLRRISKIRSFLSTDAANTLAVSFILSRLDYCNSLLTGLHENQLNKLQRIQNHAARIVLRKPRRESAKALLRALHWLPIRARIEYKVACFCFKCIYHENTPAYLCDLVQTYNPSRTLRSSDTSLLSIPRYSLDTFGKKSFSVSGPKVWNSLPLSLRKTMSFSTFKKLLKTHLFQTHLS